MVKGRCAMGLPSRRADERRQGRQARRYHSVELGECARNVETGAGISHTLGSLLSGKTVSS